MAPTKPEAEKAEMKTSGRAARSKLVLRGSKLPEQEKKIDGQLQGGNFDGRRRIHSYSRNLFSDNIAGKLPGWTLPKPDARKLGTRNFIYLIREERTPTREPQDIRDRGQFGRNQDREEMYRRNGTHSSNIFTQRVGGRTNILTKGIESHEVRQGREQTEGGETQNYGSKGKIESVRVG